MGAILSWEKSRGTLDWRWERLDRAFASPSWWAKFSLCKLILCHTYVSDHEPIHFELLSTTISKKLFRLNLKIHG